MDIELKKFVGLCAVRKFLHPAAIMQIPGNTPFDRLVQ
jgi:hypothetical protein